MSPLTNDESATADVDRAVGQVHRQRHEAATSIRLSRRSGGHSAPNRVPTAVPRTWHDPSIRSAPIAHRSGRSARTHRGIARARLGSESASDLGTPSAIDEPTSAPAGSGWLCRDRPTPQRDGTGIRKGGWTCVPTVNESLGLLEGREDNTIAHSLLLAPEANPTTSMRSSGVSLRASPPVIGACTPPARRLAYLQPTLCDGIAKPRGNAPRAGQRRRRCSTPFRQHTQCQSDALLPTRRRRPGWPTADLCVRQNRAATPIHSCSWRARVTRPLATRSSSHDRSRQAVRPRTLDRHGSASARCERGELQRCIRRAGYIHGRIAGRAARLSRACP